MSATRFISTTTNTTSGRGQGTLQRQAAWLQKYPQVRVTVEGNCDERGTREYNLRFGRAGAPIR
jgi:peptidoglycan-associated lipoprotein